MKFNKKIWIYIIIAEIILICILGFAYSKRETVSLNFTQDDLIYNTGEPGFYLDESYDKSYIATPNFTLPKGLYNLEIQYECLNASIQSIYLQYSDGQFENDVSDQIFNKDVSGASCEFYVKYKNRPMQVRGSLNIEATSEDYLLIRNITIVTSSTDIRYFILRLIVIIFTINLLILLYGLRNQICISKESQSHLKVLLFLIFINSIPLLVNYLFYDAHDLRFHLVRIEGLREGLLYGMFPVKIQPYWLNGHGYAVSVFYGDILLYIPAMLRIFGVSIQAAYQFYVLLIHTATVFISYYCFRRMSNAKIGLICTIVYTLNIYRLTCVYTRAAVGEYTAMAFLPLVLYGLWKTYTLPEESKEHQRSWIPITIGCCGIFLSHILTTEMTALFIIISIIILWKKTFRKKTFLVLIKSAALTILLTFWFLIPFLDYMISGTYIINDPSTSFIMYGMENTGIFLSQFFISDYWVTKGNNAEVSGIASEMPLTVGLSALFVFIGWLFLCLGKQERDKSEKKTEYFAVFLCIFSLWMASNLFPYTWLADKLPILKTPIGSFQFSWRFLSIAGVMLSYLLCLILQKKWIEIQKRKLFAVLLVTLSICQGFSYISKCMAEFSPLRVYQTGNLSSFNVSGNEYIPINEDIKLNYAGYINQLTYDNNIITIDNWHRDKGAVVVSLTNNGNETTQVEVPVLLYKGYHAITDNGEELIISPGTSFRVSVSVPAGFTGNFRVEFKEPWYWRLCEIISLLTVLSIAFYQVVIYNSNRTNIQNKEQL